MATRSLSMAAAAAFCALFAASSFFRSLTDFFTHSGKESPKKVEQPAPSPRSENLLYRSPNHLCFSRDGRRAYVVNQSADSVAFLDAEERRIQAQVPVGRYPVHAVLSPDGKRLYVSCLYDNRIDEIGIPEEKVLRQIQAGYGPHGLSLSENGSRLSVANSLANSVSIIDLPSGKTRFTVPVENDPRYLAEAPDGSKLLVSNGLARGLTVVDPTAGERVTFSRLGQAALLRQVACSHGGRYAFTVHLVSRDLQIPTQLEFGQIHSNGLTIVSLEHPDRWVTLLLDFLLKGAANPWGAVLSPDDDWLYVSLAGTHEIAIVELKKALELARETGFVKGGRIVSDLEAMTRRKILRRVPSGGIGPRGIALRPGTNELWICNYFSDSVAILQVPNGTLKDTVPLGPKQEMTLRRKGEMLFNDARLCFQQWFSCASCHQEDATTDGLNWDLLNDGAGNPKNNKSLYDIKDTAPAMWSGVRKNMSICVAAGQLFLGFLPQPENHKALLAFIGSLEHQPNPFRARPTAETARGNQLFRQARCGVCHPAPAFTDQKKHDLGLRADGDLRSRFDTPSLRDCVRTPPYLHDGRAKTLKEIFSRYNPEGSHGRLDAFDDEDLNCLVAYLKTL